MIRHVTGLAFAAAAALTPVPALAQAVVSGFDGITLARGDDFFSGPLNLGFTVNFFGTTYTQTYLSNNGYITFGAGQSTYTPTGLGSGYSGLPIIAAFFADVETTNPASGLVGYGAGTFDGRQAWGATFDGVGYYNDKADKLNTFQLLLVNRSDTGAGNFDIILNYDSIQWESGDVESPGNNGFGGNSAAVGYNAGQLGNPAGTYFQFMGSQTPGSFLDGGPFALAENSNVNFDGRYLFMVRNGIVQQPGIPEPETWALLIAGFGLVGAAMRRQRVTVSYA